MSTVLIMEPNPAVGELLQAVLTDAGHKPIVTPTTQLALDCLSRERVDLIVTELMERTGLNGVWEPVDALREGAPTTPIVVFTNQLTDKMTPPTEREVGVILMKPFDLNELVRCVEQMTSGTWQDYSYESR